MTKLFDRMNNLHFSEGRTVVLNENGYEGKIILEVVMEDGDIEVHNVVAGFDGNKIDNHIKQNYHEIVKERAVEYVKEKAIELQVDPPQIDEDKRYFSIPITDLHLRAFPPYK